MGNGPMILRQRGDNTSYPALQGLGLVLSQSSIFGQNPKIGCQEFNDLQTPKLSKKQLCDRTGLSMFKEQWLRLDPAWDKDWIPSEFGSKQV